MIKATILDPNNELRKRFRCPRCGGAYFGSELLDGRGPAERWKFRRFCNDEFGTGCTFTTDDDAICFVEIEP